MALHLKLKLKPQHSRLPSLRLLSSSSSLPPPPSHETSPPEPDAASPTDFSEIKQRLGSPASPLRRIPTDPPPPPSLYPNPQSQTSTASLEQIRKHLAAFRSQSPAANSNPSSSAAPPKFHDIFKSNLQNNNNTSLDEIRRNLQQSRSGSRDPFFSLKSLQESMRNDHDASAAPSLIGSEGRLPESIFGREATERKKAAADADGDEGLSTRFVKDYTRQELGEKLAKLRNEGGEKKKELGFSLSELNQRLAKLRKMEEEAARLNNPAAGAFDTIRESIRNLQSGEESKRSSCFFFF